jgi:uncharacterized protein YukE
VAEISKVRQIASQGSAKVDSAQREMQSVLNNLKNLGSGFTSERAYSSSYSQVTNAAKEVDRALIKYKEALRSVERAV